MDENYCIVMRAVDTPRLGVELPVATGPKQRERPLALGGGKGLA